MPRNCGSPAAEGPGYEVGYGKPPTATQFKKGTSGNPKGRRPGPTLAESIDKVLTQTVKVTTNGKTRKTTAEEVMLLSLAKKAAGGDRNAAKFLFDLKAAHPLPTPTVKVKPEAWRAQIKLLSLEEIMQLRAIALKMSANNAAAKDEDEDS